MSLGVGVRSLDRIRRTEPRAVWFNCDIEAFGGEEGFIAWACE